MPSGDSDPHLFFLDRIVRPKAGGAALAQYCARDCEDAETRIVHHSPLRLTVEAVTGFGRNAGGTPGRPQARYRYTYTAFSPVIEVSADYSRADDGPWRELHFLHLTRKEKHYQRFVTGDPAKIHEMQAKGQKSRPVSGPQWAVMEQGPDACGAGFENTVCWDASNEFYYYVRSACETWIGKNKHLRGGLYLGASKNPEWYSQWMGRERTPEIVFFRDNKPWLPLERETLAGEHEISNRAMRLVFDNAGNGFDCLGIENLLADNTRFVRCRPDAAGLWSLTFKTAPDADGKQEAVEINNRSPVEKRKAFTSRRGLNFVEWHHCHGHARHRCGDSTILLATPNDRLIK